MDQPESTSLWCPSDLPADGPRQVAIRLLIAKEEAAWILGKRGTWAVGGLDGGLDGGLGGLDA